MLGRIITLIIFVIIFVIASARERHLWEVLLSWKTALIYTALMWDKASLFCVIKPVCLL
jgi:hypothetical protein